MTPVELERIAGFPTRVVRAGRAGRRALFIHCTMGNAGNWTGVQAALLETLATTSFDRPGHGRSAEWDGRDGVALHDLTTAIAGRLIDQRADVIGHSWGATIALRLAMERPELVRSLVLIEPPLLAAVSGTPGYAAYVGRIDALEAAVEAGERLRAAEIFNRIMSPETPWSSVPGPARAHLAASIHRIVQERAVVIDDAGGLLAPGRLEAIDVPVLLIEGTRSPSIMHMTQNVLAARLKDVTRVLVAGAGHMVPLTHPENVAAEIAVFLKL